MQGTGAFTEHLVPVNGEVTLRVDEQHDADFDVAALRKAVHSPRIERWSGAAFDLPDELELFVVTGAPRVPLLYASENLGHASRAWTPPRGTSPAGTVGRGRG
jgi:protein-L-isoaspartate(D-aspartate) O-methyltransferase